jgi:hypothetical protein
MLTVSLAHITPKDNMLLSRPADDRWADGSAVISDKYEYGHIIYVPQHTIWLEIPTATTSKYSPELITLLKLAKQHGCDLIRLDQDGRVVSSLPRFNW